MSFVFNINKLTKASFSEDFSEKQEKTILENESINCILRSNIYGDWKILINETHDNFGCGKVDQTDEYIKLLYKEPFQKITSASIIGDESVLKDKISTGSSVGTKALKINFYKDGKLINPKEIKGTYKNIYITVWGLK